MAKAKTKVTETTHTCKHKSRQDLIDHMTKGNCIGDYIMQFDADTKVFSYEDNEDCFTLFGVTAIEVAFMGYVWNTCTNMEAGNGEPCGKGVDVQFYRAVVSIKSEGGEKLLKMTGVSEEEIRKHFAIMKNYIYKD